MNKRAILFVSVLIICIAGITVALVLDNNANTENRRRTQISGNIVQNENHA